METCIISFVVLSTPCNYEPFVLFSSGGLPQISSVEAVKLLSLLLLSLVLDLQS